MTVSLYLSRPCQARKCAILKLFFLMICFVMISAGQTNAKDKDPAMKTATGEFEVRLSPQDDGEYAAGRMTLDKSFHGDLEAVSKGQMLSHRSNIEGSAGYVAVETVTGTLAGKKGSFTLLHRGLMQDDGQSLEITVSPGSGTGELQGLSGSMNIRIEDGKHYYDFDYGY